MITLLVYFLIGIILVSVALWGTSMIPDAKIQQFARIAVVVFAAIILCYFLLSLTNGSGPDLGYHRHL